ncbi:hypothetical protein [Flavobacterium sp. 5]|uniref:hypothetical protein n=1 Tax=Flavobacterium sp. 5 TaxID=2035199 RepID=UPI000CB9098A|nr:hypothetical protein [Flavobacterium sp. 5]PKB18059.1 hypothetical protein CLU82_3314 [Flavobacterium sp. 5]
MKKIFLYPILLTTMIISFSFESYSMHSSMTARIPHSYFENKNEINLSDSLAPIRVSYAEIDPDWKIFIGHIFGLG